MQVTPLNINDYNLVIIDGKPYKAELTFNNVFCVMFGEMSISEIFQRYFPSFDGFIDDVDKVNIIDALHNRLYVDESDEENKEKQVPKEPNKEQEDDSLPDFDYMADYSLIWDSFKAYRNVDLNKDRVLWWEFTTMLEGLLLENKCSFCKMLAYRHYEKPSRNSKTQEIKINAFYMKMKRKYALKFTKKQVRQIIDNGIHNMAQSLIAYQARRDALKEGGEEHSK